ncbi:hypothetical protein CXP39_02615 [Mesoplasma syrphidae]|uniref:Uncharacterized protein n=1 Tax=Mesoplasma syrphidae TaxID=225999 RepID=A0A2K9BZ85_9MOLU|nr:hypothetical protein [Mesoplasma syrphidae]AUF83678.1 hypothetical protein CXP39_02615 [Mesoplasma syrphidae]
MDKEQLKINIQKLKKVATYLKQADKIDDKIAEIVQVMIKIIDQTIIYDNSLIFVMNAHLKKTSRVLELDINRVKDETFGIKQIHETLFLIKTIIAILLTKFNIFDFYIYSEIKASLFFYINLSLKEKFYDSRNVFFTINEPEYHLQNQIFKTLYSTFDKLTYINHYLVQRYDLKKINDDVNYRFINDFVKLSIPLFKNKAAELRFIDYIRKLYKSSAFHYIRKLRNNLEHSFTNPESQYNIAMEIELVFILAARTLFEIISDFKTDDKIYSLINKKVTK